MKNPPDRASAKDVGLTRPIRVLLNDVEMKQVVEYCISESWVDVAVTDSFGLLWDAKTGELETKRLTGVVKAEWMDQ